MSANLFLALLVNVAIGAYFAWGYPRTLAKSFRDRAHPPAFAWLGRVMPIFGKALIAASTLYGLLVSVGLLR